MSIGRCAAFLDGQQCRLAGHGELVPHKFYESGKDPAIDMVNHPPHYTNHPKGIECIEVIEEAGVLLGNAIKYIWRVEWGSKGNDLEDLRKARWYIDRAIAKRETDNA